MKIIFLTIIFASFIFHGISQEDYKPGKVILYSGELVEALVKVKSEEPLEIAYKKLNEEGVFKIKKVKQIILDSTSYFYMIKGKKESLVKETYNFHGFTLYSNGIEEFYKVDELYEKLKEKKLRWLYQFMIKDTTPPSPMTKEYFLKEYEKKVNGEISEKSLKEKRLEKRLEYAHVKSSLAGNISFFKPDVGLELKLTDKLTWYNSAGLNMAARRVDTTYKFVTPDLESGIRLFLTQKKRKEKGKFTNNFSGSYLQLGVERYFFSPSDIKDIVALSFGFQENSPESLGFSNSRVVIGMDQDAQLWFNLQWHFGISGGFFKPKAGLNTDI